MPISFESPPISAAPALISDNPPLSEVKEEGRNQRNWHGAAAAELGQGSLRAVGNLQPRSLPYQPGKGTAERLGVRWWAGYDRLSFWLAGDQEWGGFCAWWKPGSRDRAEASTCW